MQVDLGDSVQIEPIVLKPCYDDSGRIGFGFPVRFKIEVTDNSILKTGVTVVW